jgi:hypothetical protein
MTAIDRDDLVTQVHQVIQTAIEQGRRPPGRPTLIRLTGATDHQVKMALAELADRSHAIGSAGGRHWIINQPGDITTPTDRPPGDGITTADATQPRPATLGGELYPHAANALSPGEDPGLALQPASPAPTAHQARVLVANVPGLRNVQSMPDRGTACSIVRSGGDRVVGIGIQDRHRRE